SLNSGAAFAGVSTRIVTASGIYNDLGGSSGSLDIQFSEDGINWGVYHGSGTTNDKATDWEYKTTKNKSGTSQDVANAWYLEGSDGNKTVYVRTRDGAGNVDVDLASDDIILDSTPPVVAADTITSPNGAETWLGGSNHNITWDQTKVTDANLLASPIKLEYSLNNGSTWSLVADTEANDGINAWNPIPSADSNQVKVKLIATDAAGNYTSDESDNIFIIDTVGPNVGTVNALPAYNKNFTFDVPYTATDTASGIDYVKLYFKNTTNHLGWTQFGTTFTSSPISFTADQNDTYKFRLVAVDKVGLKDENDPPTNPAEEALTIVDVVAPVSTITMPEDAATCGSDVGICMYGGPTATYPWPGHITGTVTDNETGISKVEVQITTGSTYYNGTGFVGTPTWVEASITPTGPMSASYNYDIPYSKLSDGNTYTVKVRSTDAAANLETAKTRDFIYDFSAPNSGHFVINNAGDLYAKSLDVTLNFSGADNDVRKAPTYVDANGGLRISNSNDFSSSSWITYD
ncbi:hypothetical protein COX25_01895, partial [bacterium (Candidatus Howlettbacteria) CG23_combo_of_CG06-09_8_20_14_all_37_9]